MPGAAQIAARSFPAWNCFCKASSRLLFSSKWGTPGIPPGKKSKSAAEKSFSVSSEIFLSQRMVIWWEPFTSLSGATAISSTDTPALRKISTTIKHSISSVPSAKNASTFFIETPFNAFCISLQSSLSLQPLLPLLSLPPLLSLLPVLSFLTLQYISYSIF